MTNCVMKQMKFELNYEFKIRIIAKLAKHLKLILKMFSHNKSYHLDSCIIVLE